MMTTLSNGPLIETTPLLKAVRTGDRDVDLKVAILLETMIPCLMNLALGMNLRRVTDVTRNGFLTGVSEAEGGTASLPTVRPDGLAEIQTATSPAVAVMSV